MERDTLLLVIGIAVVALALLVLLGWWRSRRVTKQRRAEATEHRHEAEQIRLEAAQRTAAAEERAARARREQLLAEQERTAADEAASRADDLERRAAEVDPDVEVRDGVVDTMALSSEDRAPRQ